MSKLREETIYCEYANDLNHRFMACNACQHNMKIATNCRYCFVGSVDGKPSHSSECPEFNATGLNTEVTTQGEHLASKKACQVN